MYLVADTQFNRANYPELIGKVCKLPPAYIQVKLVDKDTDIISLDISSEEMKQFDANAEEIVRRLAKGTSYEDVIPPEQRAYEKHVSEVMRDHP